MESMLKLLKQANDNNMNLLEQNESFFEKQKEDVEVIGKLCDELD